VITLSAHQPAYLPWLGYFNKIANSDVFVILDNVQYERGSFVNRNRIKGPNGIFWLTVPLKKTGHIGKMISEMEVADNNWRDKHKKSLKAVYGRAPYYWEYEDWFAELLYIINPPQTESIWGMWELLRFDTDQIEYASDALPHTRSPKQQLIIELCKHYCADRFIFGAKGRDYCDIDLFKREGIEPLFQDFKCIEYPQLWGEFVPKLSVIDALMNVGAKRTRALIIEGWKP